MGSDKDNIVPIISLHLNHILDTLKRGTQEALKLLFQMVYSDENFDIVRPDLFINLIVVGSSSQEDSFKRDERELYY